MPNVRIELITKNINRETIYNRSYYINIDDSLTIGELKENFINKYLRDRGINPDGKILLTENIVIKDFDQVDLNDGSIIRDFSHPGYYRNTFYLDYREPLYRNDRINYNYIQPRRNEIINNYIAQERHTPEPVVVNQNRDIIQPRRNEIINNYRGQERQTPVPVVNQNRDMETMFEDASQGLLQQQQQSRQVAEITAGLEAQIAQIREKSRLGLLNPKLEVVKRRIQLYNSNQVPNEFRCPITLEIMEDPVITADGHTFERNAILMWFQNGRNLISPKTNQRLRHGNLIPNIALRNRIQDWIKGFKEEMSGGFNF